MEEFKTEFKSFKVNQIMYHFAPPFTEEFYVKAKAELADVDSFDRTFVDDKNYDKYASDDTKAAVEAAINAVSSGEITVPSAFDEGGNEAAQALRDEVRP